MPVTTAFAALTAGLFGLLGGSFLNVVAFRLPRGESLAHPRSRCPSCQTPIRPYDNVPVLSWLLLRGRCRDCRAPIAARYPLIEAGTAVLAVAVVLVKGADADVWLPLALLALLVPVTLIDLDRRIIPNRITGPGAVAALVIGALVAPGDLPQQLIAGAAAGAFLLVPALLYPAGMGMGDVKLAGMMGLFLGRDVAVAILVALIAGALVGAGIMARLGVQRGRKTGVPFGPFLALGGLAAILVGPSVISWYLGTFT
jgi:leader peptidase (prepilin peptidase) / N-methyltransferase